METIHAISERRSIRKFLDKEIPVEVMEKILNSAIQAPSAKNKQPWKFIVVTNKEKSLMLSAMQTGIDNEKKQAELLPNATPFRSSAEYTKRVMEQAPVTVFVFNTEENHSLDNTNTQGEFHHIANIQSIGAAIENMLLAAMDFGISSLWNCDVFFAYEEICKWLGEKNQLIAAISFGYSNESPKARPRKRMSDVVVWR